MYTIHILQYSNTANNNIYKLQSILRFLSIPNNELQVVTVVAPPPLHTYSFKVGLLLPFCLFYVYLVLNM